MEWKYFDFIQRTYFYLCVCSYIFKRNTSVTYAIHNQSSITHYFKEHEVHLVNHNNALINPRAFPGAERPERTRIASLHEPPALTLDERGMIRDCNKSGERLFGYQRHDLIWQHVSKLLPQLSGVALIREGRINSLLGFFCHCGRVFQARNRLGNTFPSELSFVHLEREGMRILRVIVHHSGNAKS